MGRTPGFVFRRAKTQKLIVISTLGTILLATTALTALMLYATSVTDDGIRRSLATAPADLVATRIRAPLAPDTHDAFHGQVQAAAEEAYAGAPVEIITAGRSQWYILPGQKQTDDAELTTFGLYEELDQHAALTAGRWPVATEPTTEQVEAAFPAATADDVGFAAGDTVTVTNRLDHTPVEVTITGLYVPNDPQEPFWQAEPLAVDGVERLAVTTYGPLIVPRETFLGRFAVDDVFGTWQVIPDLSDLPAPTNRLCQVGDVFASELGADGPDSRVTVSTTVCDLATRLDRAALVARSTMLIPVLQLMALAGYALFLTTHLISEFRRTEFALLRARGADGRQLASLSLREGAMLAAPAAVIAPLLAVALLRGVSESPAVRAAGVNVEHGLQWQSWAIAAAAAALCALALILPSLRGLTRTYVEIYQARGRGEKRSTLQQAGADLTLLALAGLGLWQLRHYGGPVTATLSQGQADGLGIDPFIVTGPTIGLVAGGALVLRLVPLVSGAAERVTARGRGFAPALGAWQVSRRPLRYAGPALLLVMAIAVGVLSIGTSATWRQSQADQADFAAGTDLRITGPLGRTELPMLGQGGRYAALPGVTAISPMVRADALVGSSSVEIVAIDAAKAPDLLAIRPDLYTGELADLTQPLVGARRSLKPLDLPGRPSQITLDVRAVVAGAYDGRHAVDINLLLKDGLSVRHRLPVGTLPADGADHHMGIDLAALAGTDGSVAYPLAVEGLTLTYKAAADGNIEPVEVAVQQLAVAQAPSGPAESLTVPRTEWVAGPGAAVRRIGRADSRSLVDIGLAMPVPGATTPAGTGGSATTTMTSYLMLGSSVAPLPRAGGDQPDAGFATPRSDFTTMLGVATASLLTATNKTLGDTIALSIEGRYLEVLVTGVVDALPGTEADRDAVLLDIDTFTAERLLTAGQVTPVTEWWLAASGGDTTVANAALRADPQLADVVVDRQALRRQLRDDPLGSGLQGALFLGFLAALAFAAIGFAVNAAISAKERIAEFALMRAVGVSARQVFGLLGVEQTFLVALGVAGGAALGVIVTRLVVPHIVLTAQATMVQPPVIVSLPWLPVVLLAAIVVAVLALIVAVLAASLRRSGLGATLRLGGDR